MAFLTRDKINQFDDLPIREVVVPQWGNETVYVRTLDGFGRNSIDQCYMDGKKPSQDLAEFRVIVCCLCTLGEDKQPLFIYPDDLDWLKHRNAAAVEIIFDVACDLNGLLKTNVEDAEKKS